MNTCLGQFSITYMGAKLWNNLLNNVKMSTSRYQFIKTLRQWLLQDYSEKVKYCTFHRALHDNIDVRNEEMGPNSISI